MPALQNPKHERFAQSIAKGIAGSTAYREAGYQAGGNAAEAAASRLLRDVKVQERIAELKDRGAQRAEVTIESLIREVGELQDAAKEAKQISAAVAALTAKAKLAGLWVERSENENLNTNYVVSSDPVDNVEDWEAEYAPKH